MRKGRSVPARRMSGVAVRKAVRDAATIVSREVALQMQQRRRPRTVVRNGIKIELAGPWATDLIREVVYSGWYEAHELDLLRETLLPTDVYLEVGAGIGVLATAACRIVGEERVTAVEASPEMAKVARYTAKINGFSPDIRSGVVVDEEAPNTVPFFVHRHFWASGLEYDAEAERVDLPALRLAPLVDEVSATYLNMDVEGAEVALLRRELPSSIRSICLEVHPRVTGHEAISDTVKVLLDQGFKLNVEKMTAEVLYLAR